MVGLTYYEFKARQKNYSAASPYAAQLHPLAPLKVEPREQKLNLMLIRPQGATARHDGQQHQHASISSGLPNSINATSTTAGDNETETSLFSCFMVFQHSMPMMW